MKLIAIWVVLTSHLILKPVKSDFLRFYLWVNKVTFNFKYTKIFHCGEVVSHSREKVRKFLNFWYRIKICLYLHNFMLKANRTYRVVSKFQKSIRKTWWWFWRRTYTQTHSHKPVNKKEMLAHVKVRTRFCKHIISVTYLYIRYVRMEFIVWIWMYMSYINFKVQCSY